MLLDSQVAVWILTSPDRLGSEARRMLETFDRPLVAQTHAEDLPFLTSDRVLLSLRRPFLVDATV